MDKARMSKDKAGSYHQGLLEHLEKQECSFLDAVSALMTAQIILCFKNGITKQQFKNLMKDAMGMYEEFEKHLKIAIAAEAEAGEPS